MKYGPDQVEALHEALDRKEEQAKAAVVDAWEEDFVVYTANAVVDWMNQLAGSGQHMRSVQTVAERESVERYERVWNPAGFWIRTRKSAEQRAAELAVESLKKYDPMHRVLIWSVTKDEVTTWVLQKYVELHASGMLKDEAGEEAFRLGQAWAREEDDRRKEEHRLRRATDGPESMRRDNTLVLVRRPETLKESDGG